MRTDKSNAGSSAYYTVREAAGILGVKPSTVSAAIAIRLGTLRAVRRRSRLMVPASALTRLLAEPTIDGGKESR
ncbi:MAG: helix-turn-helix domain-containing protein [Pseudonocardiales bacterium]|nr:helix-turn-helix domain-containing protein [Pseudonocardiales bacterium]